MYGHMYNKLKFLYIHLSSYIIASYIINTQHIASIYVYMEFKTMR